ncbi:MAG: type II toxin-antitoxin system RelE/ParE family toxin [Xanthobacteraceae bacterium]|nr:type II toxin-antitoxin system RelE/ParE family toxin [Xanthobacteraceae bacterium]MBX3521178.1 type II toxin-antitoxin system RelE/ParE family toxin [Xanthobacteraceae bacterium]MCW5675402.1 type II toxin-antitoxin system RelE/ParE family toxin [Xanthobacteraceae bacterium]
MHTVIETPAFLASAREEGLDEQMRADIVAFLALNPTAGEMMVGTGGARKVRFAGRGKGKSGGYRVITFYGGEDMPIFLLDVFGKGSKANLTAAEKSELKKLLTSLPELFRAQTRRQVAKIRRR